ncbi:uncharacterized protein [Cicer arietinum]|uniref:Uncharacterized protein LOC101514551 isoform X2 n=1 Tax=Cicer arietinum TaxID=3827 RepID=A0A3Q7WX75_CICAR|nr:uncharacterized protein LOC101514551 isoform X2 [Cicer arietinum]
MFLFLSLSIVLSSPSRSSSPLSFSTPSPPLPSCSSPPSSYPMNLVFSKPTFTFEEVDLEVFGLQIKVPFDNVTFLHPIGRSLRGKRQQKLQIGKRKRM